MRRLLVVVSTLAVLGAGFWIPATAMPATGPTDAVTAGTVKLVVGTDPVYGIPSWTTTISGQVAAGGRTYSGTASGTDDPVADFDSFAPLITFSGSSSTGSIAATCGGHYVTVPQSLVFSAPQPTGTNPAGLLQANCNVSIDGAPAVSVTVLFALAPTSDPTVFQGVYAAAPDAAGLPGIPIVSLGHASAVLADFGDGATIGFGFDGQISTGLQTYRGSASGGTPYSSGTFVSIDVPSFTLSGSSVSGVLNATCSGEFVSDGLFASSDNTNAPALAVIGCDGSANGGPPGRFALVSIYLGTGSSQFTADYDGAFVGI